SINTRGPVLDTVACGRRAFPATPARGSLEDFLQSLIELDIETFDAHFVLLDGKAAIIPIGIHGTQAGDLIKAFGEKVHHHAFTREWFLRQTENIFLRHNHELELRCVFEET